MIDEYAKQRGYMEKKASSSFAGYQKRYFKFDTNGKNLLYYKN